MDAHGLWRPLGELLVERELLSPEQLEQALVEQAHSGRRLGEIIVAAGLVRRERLPEVLLAPCGRALTTQGGFGSGLRGQLERRRADDPAVEPRAPVHFRVEKEEPEAKKPKRVGILRARRFRKQLNAAAKEFDVRGKALEENLHELKRLLAAPEQAA